MIRLEDFSAWMKENTSLSDASVYKYTRAVNTVSKEMHEKDVISKSLIEMSILQLDISIPLILRDPDFIIKNTTGNNMYSNALKQFRLFRNVEFVDDADKVEVESIIEDYDTLKETERSVLMKSRIGQGIFRKQLLVKYNNTCIITGISEKKLLIASHVKPWAACNNEERLSAENGLLLSPTFDKLFDCGLISFTNIGKLLISSQLSDDAIRKLHVSTGMVFDLKVSNTLKHNLEYHRDVVFTTQGKK